MSLFAYPMAAAMKLSSDSTEAIDNALSGDVDAQEVVESVKSGALQTWFENQVPSFISFFWSVVIALIVWFVGVKILSVLRKMLVKTMKYRDMDTGVVQFLDSMLKYAGYLVLFIIILNIFGVATTSVAAAVASIGVTAGLALQGSLSNFAGGILILMLHPFRVGDYIVEDTHGNEGTVAEISVFYTKLKTVDNKVIIIPNGVLANASMTNVTHADKRMINLEIPISYEDDIRTAKKLLEGVIADETRVLSGEATNVFVSELGESSVNLGMRFWVKTEDYWAVRWDTLETVKYTLDENGITIPYNQLDVHVQEH